MTVKSCEKLEKSRVALTIETSAEEFEAAVNKAYLKMRGKINVPGFRVGKAPRKIIEKMYGAEVFYEEAVNIIPVSYTHLGDHHRPPPVLRRRRGEGVPRSLPVHREDRDGASRLCPPRQAVLPARPCW